MRINPNSSIRSGYRFEDLIFVQTCFNWLKSPKLFTSVRAQYIPDEIKTSKFYLDDIVTTSEDGSYSFYQLKYKQNPTTDFWAFDDLLEKNGKKTITA